MFDLTIAPYFPFRRIKIINQSVDIDASKASIEILPHKLFKPVGCRRRQRGTGRFDSYGGWACPAGQFNHSTFHASLLYRGGPDQENEK
jgi:hypothetical protein